MATDTSKRTEVRSDCNWEHRIGENLVNGHTVNASGQEMLFPRKHSVVLGDMWGNSSKWKRNTIVLSVLLGISVTINIGLGAKLRQMPAAPSPPDASSDASPCPQRWLMNEGRCYFFSDTEATWNGSWTNCSSQGGSLLAMETLQEWDFVRQSKRPRYYWIGLQRTEVGEFWKWANGSLFNNWFSVGGEGLCAYLNKDTISSTWCDNHRYWICSKHLHGNP